MRRNLNYWDSVSTLAGEVSDPAHTFPRALAGAVVLVVLTYALPLLACLGAVPDAQDWTLGYFVPVAKKLGGRWLSYWMVAAAAVSQVGDWHLG